MQEKRRRKQAPSTAPAHVAETPDAAATGVGAGSTGVRYDPDELFPNSPRLSDREREALQLVSDAKSNEVIATVMGNSKRTVQDHVSKVLRKLDVDNREEAVALYYHAIQTKLELEIAELTAQIRALQQQNAALRRQLRRNS
jgi:DNA-binding CsgD family transcriptional regulator